jgi:3-hydroxyacyl-CoA dehydrogenase
MNEVAQYAERYQSRGGIALMDQILGCFTGRAMPPLVTVDMVGLDIHKAIVDNLYQNTHDGARGTFVLPQFMQHLINIGKFGVKSGEGLYKTIRYPDGRKERFFYDIPTQTYAKISDLQIAFAQEARRRVALADYRGALRVICEDRSEEAHLCRYFLARYLSYAFSIIGEVVNSRECIDTVMGFGYNWAPPSGIVDLLGGVGPAVKLIESAGLQVPRILANPVSEARFYHLQNKLDVRSLFRVK